MTSVASKVINMDDHRTNGPQVENGFVRVANELYDAILSFKFTFRQSQVVFAVIRKTYGYGKKSDDISASQIGAMCAMPRPHVASTLVELEQMGVLVRERGKFGTITSLNKNYREWRHIKKAEAKKVNEGFGGAVSRNPSDRSYHYVYRLDHEESGSFYIGVRSCDCHPNQDRYKGSGSWTATVRGADVQKTILSMHESREEAEAEEKRVIRALSGTTGMGNRVRYVSTDSEHVQNLNIASTETVHADVQNLNSSVVQDLYTQKTTFQKTTSKEKHTADGAEKPAPSVPEEFAVFWSLYPKREGSNSRADALKAWNARIRTGVKAEDMLAGVKRYAAYCTAKGMVGTQYVKQGASFLGKGEHWAADWAFQSAGNVSSLKPDNRGLVAGLLPGSFV